MDGGPISRCGTCTRRLPSGAIICPTCGDPFPAQFRGLDERLRAEHPSLRVALITAMWVWLLSSVGIATTFLALFIVRLP